jgi:polyribonucleotide 5'-hydroxyl-kinase
VVVELMSGVAEIFGTEMVLHTKYHLGQGAKVAVFTYHGCTVQVRNSSPFITWDDFVIG